VVIDIETDVADPGAIGPVVAEAAPTPSTTSPRAPTSASRGTRPPRCCGSRARHGRGPGRRPGVGDRPARPRHQLRRGLRRGPTEDLPLTEDSPVAPATPYAASKSAAEQVALQAWRGFGQPVIVVRPFNHIAPARRRPSRSRPWPGGSWLPWPRGIVAPGRHLTTRRDFTDVRDVVRAYRLLVEHGEPGSLYNVCSGHDVAIGEIADRLLSLADATLTLETDPALVRPVDLPVLRGDPGRLERATGWKPTIALDDTIATSSPTGAQLAR